VLSDDYGDFWFKGLGDGIFDLKITWGDKVKAFTGLDTTENSVNVGDIPIESV